jgi:hypothetical protein
LKTIDITKHSGLFSQWLTSDSSRFKVDPETIEEIQKGLESVGATLLTPKENVFPPGYMSNECWGDAYESTRFCEIFGRQMIRVNTLASLPTVGFDTYQDNLPYAYFGDNEMGRLFTLTATSCFDERIAEAIEEEPFLILRTGQHYMVGECIDDGKRLKMALNLGFYYCRARKCYFEGQEYEAKFKKHLGLAKSESCGNLFGDVQNGVRFYIYLEMAKYMLMFMKEWCHYTSSETQRQMIEDFFKSNPDLQNEDAILVP